MSSRKPPEGKLTRAQRVRATLTRLSGDGGRDNHHAVPVDATLPREAVTPDDHEVAIASLLLRLCRTKKLTLEAPDVPHEGLPVDNGENFAKHTNKSLVRRSLRALWASEGEDPVWKEGSALTELQVWHRGRLHRYVGLSAMRRLSVLAPTVFCETAGGRNGAVAQLHVGATLVVRVTGTSLARSYSGATGGAACVPAELADTMLRPKWRPDPDAKGLLKSTRYFECLVRVYTWFCLMFQHFRKTKYWHIGAFLVSEMAREGRSQPPSIVYFLDALQVILHGRTAAKDDFQRYLLTLAKEERAELWRCRRLFTKDDNDPLQNARDAIARMVVPAVRSTEDDALGLKVLEAFGRKAADFVAGNLDALKKRHDGATMHRSSATLFFTRALGGGAAELHLTVALFRLSQGRNSALQDVWGYIPEDVKLEQLVEIMQQHGPRRSEVEDACSWMIDELDRREVAYPYLCIYPEREPKSRNFMLLPYALQLGGYNAATTLGLYLRTREDTREVFAGFETVEWLARAKQAIENGATHVLSLDSKVSTDPLPHALCRLAYAPFYPAFSEYTKKCVERIFAPTRVFAATRRPADFLRSMAFEETLKGPLDFLMRRVSPTVSYPAWRQLTTMWGHPGRVPAFLRTHSQRQEVANALKERGRVLLKAPTGSGKTVLAVTLFNSIVQFPSTAAIDIMSEWLTAQGIPHNAYHSRRKVADGEWSWDFRAGEPNSILCTAFYMEELSQRFPGMVCVLDEAETKQENYLLNLEWTRRTGRKTLLMTATPDEILGEASTAVVELTGGTNYPVEDRQCTNNEMLGMLRSKQQPMTLVIVQSEPLCDKIARQVTNAGRTALSLTARVRSGDYLEQLKGVDVIVATNAVRSSVTLPDVVVVFDYGRIYESVDFPLSGLESLVLMEASGSMRLQARGRVGRTQPGVYYTVTDPPGDAIGYNPAYLARLPRVASLIGEVPFHAYARKVNLASAVVERFSQELAGAAGVKLQKFCPLWVSIIKHFAPDAPRRLMRIISFEVDGIAGRSRQMMQDVGMSERYRDFLRDVPIDYPRAVETFMADAHSESWFPAEMASLGRWDKQLQGDETSQPFGAPNHRALALALWRQLARAESGQLVGLYRNFSVPTPSGYTLKDGEAYLVLGMSLHQNAVSCRGLLPLRDATMEWIHDRVAQVQVVPIDVNDGEEATPALLGWDVTLQNAKSQRRHLSLSYSQYTRNHVFRPENAERIWKHMLRTLYSTKEGEVQVTVQGSPMSSTASFPVLNAFGLAAHDYMRDHPDPVLRHSMLGAAVFGDDDWEVAPLPVIRESVRAREATGLQTKQEATGLAHVATGGVLRRVKDQLGLFTERVIDLTTFTEVPSIKPAGLLRLFQSMHPESMMLATESYYDDLQTYALQIATEFPAWHATLTGERGISSVRKGAARRQTAPRRILSKMLTGRLNTATSIAEGDVERLFDQLEQAFLLVCPSSRGAPDRVLDPAHDPLGHPVISFDDAAALGELLQSDDCYFKTHGPPLHFWKGRSALEAVADRETERRHQPVSPAEASHLFHDWNWGSNSFDPFLRGERPEATLPAMPPVEYGDVTVDT